MLRRNLFANYIGAAFSVGAQILVIPLYLRALGPGGWGVLSGVIALSASLLVLEAGVSLAVARAFSLRLAFKREAIINGLHTVEKRYAVFSLLAFCVAILVAMTMNRNLISTVPSSLALILFISGMCAAQVMSGLYRSVLIGTGYQASFNVLLVSFILLRHALGVFSAFRFNSVTVVAFCFMFSAIFELLARRVTAIRVLGSEVRSEPSLVSSDGAVEVRGAIILAVAGMLGALGTQADRVLLGHFIRADALGYYAIAASVSLAVLQLIYPVSSALLPKLSGFRTQTGASREMMLRSYGVLIAVLACVWVAAVFLMPRILKFWLTSAVVTLQVQRILYPHLIGTSLNALCVPIYLGLLARHADKKILLANSLALSLQLTTLLIGIPSYSAQAAAYAWVVSNATLLFAYVALLQNTSNERHE